EPATCGSEDRCSIQLSYGRKHTQSVNRHLFSSRPLLLLDTRDSTRSGRNSGNCVWRTVARTTHDSTAPVPSAKLYPKFPLDPRTAQTWFCFVESLASGDCPAPDGGKYQGLDSPRSPRR